VKTSSEANGNAHQEEKSTTTSAALLPTSLSFGFFMLFAGTLQRWRPVTWFRKKGWPVLDLYFCSSFGSSMAGHAIRLSPHSWTMAHHVYPGKG
jgi:hypothetical protein